MTLNVLSIDWDYFIDTTSHKRLVLFPDGGNEYLPNDIGNMIWAVHYINSSSGRELRKINANIAEIENLMNIISASQPLDILGTKTLMVAKSHSKIYNMISDVANTLKKEYDEEFIDLNLVNIDFHHDCYFFPNKDLSNYYNKPSIDVDCGNWVWNLAPMFYGFNYTWVHHNENDVERNDFDNMANYWKDDPVVSFNEYESISDVADFKPDIVFICRSDMWSPPHLDYDFIDMVDTIRFMKNEDDSDKFCEEIEKYVLDSRMFDTEFWKKDLYAFDENYVKILNLEEKMKSDKKYRSKT
jgi:hypothetical protein